MVSCFIFPGSLITEGGPPSGVVVQWSIPHCATVPVVSSLLTHQ
jgi:hypothetical protein